MDFVGGKDSPSVFTSNEEVGKDNKGKAKLCDEEDVLTNDATKSSASELTVSVNVNSSNSELSYHDDDDNEEELDDFGDDASDYDYNENFLYDYEDDYLAMQSQFDHVDLPPGVEAAVSLPWIKDSASSQGTSDLSDSKRKATVPVPMECNKKATLSDLLEKKSHLASSSSSAVAEESCSNGKDGNEENGDLPEAQNFKQFDVVADFPDHHYGAYKEESIPAKDWAKKIQEEWKILETNLPDTIFVRVSEARMALLRAVMIGPRGTPYHDGLFVFDCLFPNSYPHKPPMVYYYSGGIRINPNLYECGKVCLSLLGTWTGKTTEMWDPKKSTMLQVLVSIQALVLNDKPFFNEPGYETTYVGASGEMKSRSYNEEVFILSLKTMMYTLRRPPKHFEGFVAQHFRNHALDILITCKAYLEGAVIGSVVVKDGKAEVGQMDKRSIGVFKSKVDQWMNILITNFVRNGSPDCEQFRTVAANPRLRLAENGSN